MGVTVQVSGRKINAFVKLTTDYTRFLWQIQEVFETFLTVLYILSYFSFFFSDLTKNGLIDVEQEEMFGDIRIWKK